MSSIIQMIEAAGARAEALPGIARELFASIEGRISAVEEKVEALAAFANPVARASEVRAAATSAVAAAIAPASAKLKSAAKAAAAALEEAIADDETATAAAPAAPATKAQT